MILNVTGEIIPNGYNSMEFYLDLCHTKLILNGNNISYGLRYKRWFKCTSEVDI